MVEVINPRTGEAEPISRADPTFSNAGGFKARKYGSSSKPKDIPPFVWQSMSVKARREAIQRLKARSDAELKRLEEKIPGVASIINQLDKAYEDDSPPSMPTCAYSEQRHRVKLVRVSLLPGTVCGVHHQGWACARGTRADDLWLDWADLDARWHRDRGQLCGHCQLCQTAVVRSSWGVGVGCIRRRPNCRGVRCHSLLPLDPRRLLGWSRIREGISILVPQKDIDPKSRVGGGQHTRSVVFLCGALDHWQRDCPQAGKGKGQRYEREWHGYGQSGYRGGYRDQWRQGRINGV